MVTAVWVTWAAWECNFRFAKITSHGGGVEQREPAVPSVTSPPFKKKPRFAGFLFCLLDLHPYPLVLSLSKDDEVFLNQRFAPQAAYDKIPPFPQYGAK
jgi:hypothetical protein